MLKRLLCELRRFRTWVFNLAVALGVFVPDILNVLAGYDWSPVVPPKYLPFVGLTVTIVNVMLRPRPAAVKKPGE